MERHVDELEPVQCEQHLFLARPVMVVFFYFMDAFIIVHSSLLPPTD